MKNKSKLVKEVLKNKTAKKNYKKPKNLTRNSEPNAGEAYESIFNDKPIKKKLFRKMYIKPKKTPQSLNFQTNPIPKVKKNMQKRQEIEYEFFDELEDDEDLETEYDLEEYMNEDDLYLLEEERQTKIALLIEKFASIYSGYIVFDSRPGNMILAKIVEQNISKITNRGGMMEQQIEESIVQCVLIPIIFGDEPDPSDPVYELKFRKVPVIYIHNEHDIESKIFRKTF